MEGIDELLSNFAALGRRVDSLSIDLRCFIRAESLLMGEVFHQCRHCQPMRAVSKEDIHRLVQRRRIATWSKAATLFDGAELAALADWFALETLALAICINLQRDAINNR